MPVLSVAKAELRILLREKGNFFWLIVMPIAFMIVFGSIFGRATDPSRSVLTQIVSGYTVMFAFYVIISLVRRILRDKESGMIPRRSISPACGFRTGLSSWYSVRCS
jgi:ABC-2 type transport system permease protein